MTDEHTKHITVPCYYYICQVPCREHHNPCQFYTLVKDPDFDSLHTTVYIQRPCNCQHSVWDIMCSLAHNFTEEINYYGN